MIIFSRDSRYGSARLLYFYNIYNRLQITLVVSYNDLRHLSTISINLHRYMYINNSIRFIH